MFCCRAHHILKLYYPSNFCWNIPVFPAFNSFNREGMPRVADLGGPALHDSHDGDSGESEPETRAEALYRATTTATADVLSPAEPSRKWTDSEESALIEFWRENVVQYTTKTKRFFYDSAARVPALRRKNVAQIKSKCFDIEKRYRETTKLLRTSTDPEATSRRWVLKKFSLYYDVQPLLSELDAPASVAEGSSYASPLPAGVPSFTVQPLTGKKRVLTGGAPPPVPTPPPYVPSKRQRADIERLARANDLAIVANAAATAASSNSSSSTSTSTSASVGAATEALDVDAETRAVASSPAQASASVFASPVLKSSAPASAAVAGSEPAPASPHFSLQVAENKELMEAAAQKMRAEARIATIRAHAALLRERKALLEEGISVSEIDALLPLQSLV